ncbi:unnamed protein product [Dibothriocephalus latus]|uniref:Uncharacterized protein n=1 Tax=Dibothriocephalus latus TaxID=60516 RepID=A0A3P7N4R4_DIBLA|nr:unnamed protein product [Dibothriocephalus latus]
MPSPVQFYVTGLGSALAESSSSPSSSQAAGQSTAAAEEASTSETDGSPVAKSTLARLNLVNAENWDLFLKMVPL